MEKVLKCDAIFLGCGHVIRTDSEEELISLAAEHARLVHGVTEIDENLARQVQAAITEE